MPFDFSRVKQWLSQSKIQKDNNSLFQVINSLITGLVELTTVEAQDNTNVIALINGINSVVVIDVDTSITAQSVELSLSVKPGKMYVIKDTAGNASSNNITIVGTVEGTVDPVINTDYGIYRVYQKAIDSLYFQW